MNRPALAAPTLLVLTVAFALAGPMLSVAPLGMAPLLVAAGALSYGAERVSSGTWRPTLGSSFVVLLILLIWCTVSLSWDINPKDGARKLLDLVMVALSLAALLALARRIAPSQRRTLALALVGGVVLGLVLLGVETIFDFPLYRSVMGNSDPKLADLVESKRSVDALPLLVWPACLALVVAGSAWAGAILAVAFAVACVKLTASSATLGMFISLLIFAATFASIKWVRRGLAGLTFAAFILVIPVAFLAYDHGGTHAHWLKRSAQHRVEIWHFRPGASWSGRCWAGASTPRARCPTATPSRNSWRPTSRSSRCTPITLFCRSGWSWARSASPSWPLSCCWVSTGSGGGRTSEHASHSPATLPEPSSPASPSGCGRPGGWRLWPSRPPRID